MNRFKWMFGRTGYVNEARSYKKYTILVTDECNLACTYCFQRYKEKGVVMSENTIKAFIDKVFAIEIPRQAYQDVFFQFCCGEALLYPDIIDFGVSYLKEKHLPYTDKHMMLNVLSNGTTLNNLKVQKLLCRHPELGVSVSIDGAKETHNKLRGQFDVIYDGYQWVKELYKQRGKLPRIQMTVSTENVSELAAGFRYLSAEFTPEIWISLVMEDKNWAQDAHAVTLYEQLCQIANFMMLPENRYVSWTNVFDVMQYQPVPRHLPICSAIQGQLVCTPEGKLYPCYVHRNPSINIDYSLGDVAGWIDEEKHQKLCACTIEATTGLEYCINCDIGLGCKRCSAHYAERYQDMYNGDTSFCKAHHAKYWATQYLIKLRSGLCD